MNSSKDISPLWEGMPFSILSIPKKRDRHSHRGSRIFGPIHNQFKLATNNPSEKKYVENKEILNQSMPANGHMHSLRTHGCKIVHCLRSHNLTQADCDSPKIEDKHW